MTDQPTPTPPEDATGAPAEPKVFTQEQVNAFLAEDRRKSATKFADYDALKTKAEEFDAAQDAAKTDLQRALDRATAAEAKVAGFESERQVATWAAEIVQGSDVPAAALRGATREELLAHFEELKPLVTKQPGARVRTSIPPGTPAPESGKGRAAAALREMSRGL